MAAKVRDTGEMLCAKATAFLENHDIETVDEALKINKQGLELQKFANRLAAPEQEEQKQRIIDNIAKLIGTGIAARDGELVSRAASRVRATAQDAAAIRGEFTVAEGEAVPLRELPGTDAEVHSGDFGGDVDA